MNHPKNKGYSLLEITIALLVFSIGLMGLTRAQLTSMKMASQNLVATQKLWIKFAEHEKK